jgi:hypothetical protein
MAAAIALLAFGLALLSAPCLAAVSLQAYDDLLIKAQVLRRRRRRGKGFRRLPPPLNPCRGRPLTSRVVPCPPQADSAAAFKDFASMHAKPYLEDVAEYSRRHVIFQARPGRSSRPAGASQHGSTSGISAAAAAAAQMMLCRSQGPARATIAFPPRPLPAACLCRTMWPRLRPTMPAGRPLTL